MCKEDAAKAEAVTTKWDSHSEQDKAPEVVLVVPCGSLEDNSAWEHILRSHQSIWSEHNLQSSAVTEVRWQ